MSDSATMPAAALRRTDLPKLSLGTKTAATLLAIVAAVVLPQLFHVIGAVSGQGTMLGVAFLPMHLPIIFVGLIAGPAVGAIAGAAAPLVSFLLSGMPMLAMLPLMMVELCAYGLVAGLLRGIKLPSLAKVVIAQLAGRVVLTAATLLAIVAAVVLPQLFHVIGAVSGQGTMLGVAFLPMHLPIIFVGLIAGPAVGAIAGAAAPLVSFLLSGMPMLAMLPLMMVELCAYGLVAGLLRGIKLPSLAKVVIAQLAGRVVLTAATAIAVFAFGSSKAIAATWTSDLAAGLPGLALQWALIPLAAYWTESLIAKRNH